MNKKASMQLSINMIVILIIAVVILGLALGFIQGMFGKMAKTFEQEVAAEPDAPSGTPSNPLTMSKAGANIIASPGEEIIIKWGYYCVDEVNCTITTITFNEECTAIITPTVLAKEIVSGTSEQIFSKFVIIKTATPSTYLCTASVGSQDKDFTLKII